MEEKNLGLGAGAVILGVVTWLYFQTLSQKAAFYPKIVSAVIILLGLIIALRAVKALKTAPGSPEQFASGREKGAEQKGKENVSLKSVALIVLYLFVYYFLFQKFSYTVSTFLLIAGASATLGYRNVKVLIPTAALVSIGLYLSFTQLFHVRFMAMFF